MHVPKINTTGLENWQRTLYILFFAQLMVAVGFASIFPFLPLYVEELGSTTGLSIEFLSGMVYSAQAFTMMLSSPVWGALADRFGRKIMVERSMFGGVVILLLMSFVTSAEQLVVLRAIQGLITGTIAAASALLASVTPRRQIGYAMGLLQVGFGTGIAMGPLIGGAVADLFSYSVVFYITAAMLFLAGVLVHWGVHENFKPVKSDPGKKTSFIEDARSLIRVTGVKMTFVIRFLTSLARMMILPIIPLFIATILVDTSKLNTFTGLVMGTASAATTISAVFLGKLGDRIGFRLVLITSMAVMGGLLALQGYVTAGWQLLVLQGLAGVALGGVLPIISALLANYTKVGGEGAAFGLDNSITAAGRAVAPMLGAAIATGWSYSAVFVAAGLVYLISTLLAFWRLPPSRPIAESTE
jgi:DHA1 family multidrug resistance protein-like MFS transporter